MSPEVRKKAMRSALRQKANDIDEATRQAYSLAIGKNLISTIADALQPADGALAVYWPVYSEPALQACYLQLGELGYRLALPRMRGFGLALEFVPWLSTDVLVVNQWGISEVTANTEALQYAELAAIVAPCLGYSKGRHRLGYGGGFYDRSLAQWRVERTQVPALTIGVAYSVCKWQESLEPQGHDVALDAIITEEG